jgi:hypothetical protein
VPRPLEAAALVQQAADELVAVGGARLSFNECTVPVLEA